MKWSLKIVKRCHAMMLWHVDSAWKILFTILFVLVFPCVSKSKKHDVWTCSTDEVRILRALGAGDPVEAQDTATGGGSNAPIIRCNGLHLAGRIGMDPVGSLGSGCSTLIFGEPDMTWPSCSKWLSKMQYGKVFPTVPWSNTKHSQGVKFNP